ncbi:MAG TPA: SOS response-associated peptidase [Pontiella sp.]
MCGRFTQTKTREEASEELGGIELPPLFHRRFNVAPSQHVAVIRQSHSDIAQSAVWGFERKGTPVINARSETLTERSMFRDLLSTNRCLIPADGFFEWKEQSPYYFQLPNRRLFAFAGLWRDGRCVIITRSADHNMRQIHHRMPVILPVQQWNLWLQEARYPDPPQLSSRPVARRVNRVIHDDPACLDPGEEQIDLSLFPSAD